MDLFGTFALPEQTLFGRVRRADLGDTTNGSYWGGERGLGDCEGDDHQSFGRITNRARASLSPELSGEGADNGIELVFGGLGVVKAGDEGLQRVMDATPTELTALPSGRQIEQAQGGVGIDLQRCPPGLPERGGEAQAALSERLDQPGRQDRDSLAQEFALDRAAAGAWVVSARAIIFQATTSTWQRQRRVYRHGAIPPSLRGQRHDLSVGVGGGEEFESTVTQDRDTSITMR